MFTREHLKAYKIIGQIALFVFVVYFVLHKASKTQKAARILTPVQKEHITYINTGNTTPADLVNFACSLAGTPYKYGSADPKDGFDCSGYMTYVFNHFHIMVPRTSVDFTPVQHPVKLQDAKLGDLILFTGTDSTDRTVGHMGIISSTPGEPLRFMHATSGRQHAVMESDFYTPYYESRFVKVIRVFSQNDEL
jgi:murein DD-endopeptidase / murein LD-carboxypeptidase